MTTTNSSSEYVKLISADDFTFVIDRRVAMGSGTIRNMLAGQFTESAENEIHFRDIKCVQLELEWGEERGPAPNWDGRAKDRQVLIWVLGTKQGRHFREGLQVPSLQGEIR